MSKAGDFVILHTQDAAAVGEEADNAVTINPKIGARRKLGDISNLPKNQKGLVLEDKTQCITGTTKEVIEQLQKEKVALRNSLAVKNKIIARIGSELERLSTELIKMQKQNRELALSNTQMLLELNTGKDRLKTLQHELGCRDGLLKSIKPKLKENISTGQCQNADVELVKFLDEGESLKEGGDNEKSRNTKRRRRAQSFESSESLQSEVNTVKKRSIARRPSRSMVVESKDSKPTKDCHESSDAKIPDHPMANESVPENELASVNAVENEDNDDRSISTFRKASRRSSMRQASKKVQSYKEIPLNIKMRRPG